MYIDATDTCTRLNMVIGFGGTDIRAWDIKVTQYSCEYSNLAPEGCDQWYFGEGTGSVRSFNYNSGSGQHLALQDQNICVR